MSLGMQVAFQPCNIQEVTCMHPRALILGRCFARGPLGKPMTTGGASVTSMQGKAQNPRQFKVLHHPWPMRAPVAGGTQMAANRCHDETKQRLAGPISVDCG